MKTSLQPGRVMPKAVLALCVLSACTCATTSFAQQYPPSQPKPRVGTRFLNFVKDLVWGEEPENRYRGYSPPPNSAPQHGYGSQGGRRYNLDSPPPAAAYDAPPPYPQQQQQQHPYQQRPVPPPPSENHLSQPEGALRDMPYTSPRDQRVPERERQQNREEVEEETPASVRQKPRVEEQQKKVEETPPSETKPRGGLFSRKSEPKKEVEESLPESKPEPRTQPLKTADAPKTPSTPKQDPPAETQKETVVASNNAREKGAGSSNSSSTPSTSNAATLTGTKTTKAGLVKSPYPPYNELDVTGLPSGSLAMDPTTGKVFRVP